MKYTRLRTAGIATLGVVYSLNLLVAAISSLAYGSGLPRDTSPLSPLFVPIVGPWIALGHPLNQGPPGATALVFDGLSQLASTTMIVMAIVLHQLELPQTAWRISPSPGGVTFSAQF